MKKYCEFIGDSKSPWDGEKKGKCIHMGFRNCVLHKQELSEDGEGWRMCCSNCKTPYYIKDGK